MYYDHTPHFIYPWEIQNVLSSSYFYASGLVFVLDKQKNGYDLNIVEQPVVKYQEEVQRSFKDGKTLVIKGLENFNENIANYARSLGLGVDVHMYLVPENGDHAFDFHVDDRDVVIHGVYGKKDFEIIRQGVILPYSPTDVTQGIVIRQGEKHRAIPRGGSCILSFGIPLNHKLRKFELPEAS